MTTQIARPDNGIPGVYGLLLLEVASRFGISEEMLFSPFGLTSEQLADPNFRYSAEQANDLLKHALELTGEDSLGYHMGTQMRISIHGFIGYAIMSASNIAEALMLASRFIQLRIPFLRLHVSTMQPKAKLQLFCDDLTLEPLRQELLIALTVGILTMGKALTGKDIYADIECDFAEPKGFAHYKDMIHSSISFGKPHLIAHFDKSYLALPLVNADPIASQIAINQCEAELSKLGERKRLAMKVRDLLTQSNERYPSIETIAEQLHMSDRTLKRQLAAEGTSYSNVVDEVRYRHAISLLSRSDYSLEQISDQLGYSDVGNFTRAFKRWTGRTPGNWRKDPYL
jgi:AraC-like DNA-binding protein